MKFYLNTSIRRFVLNLGRLRFGINGVTPTITPIDVSPRLDFSKATNSQYIPIF